MKKIILLTTIGFTSLCTLNSCDTYRSLNNVTKISQLSANPFLQNVAKSVIKNLGNTLIQSGIKNIGKLGLNTNLTSLLSNVNAVSGFKNMLTSTYGLPTQLVDNNMNKLNTIKDIVSLVSTTGTKGLNFFNL